MMALVLVLCDEWLLVIGRYMVVSLWWELMPKKRSGTSCSHFARFISSMEWDVGMEWNMEFELYFCCTLTFVACRGAPRIFSRREASKFLT